LTIANTSRFTTRYNTMVVFLFRPSPQVPKPSVRAATLCYDASAFNVRMQNAQMDSPSVDITWIFLQSLFMAVNTLLWTISYPQIRSLHSKEEIEELIHIALGIITRCTERWPGSASAAELYQKLTTACLRSYTVSEIYHTASSLSANSPASLTDATSPNSEHSSATTGSLAHSQKAFEPPPAFGYVFDQAPDNFAATEYHNSLGPPPQPTFRSGSIFVSPVRIQTDRRFSYFPPEFSQPLPNSWDAISPPPPNPQFNSPPPPPPPAPHTSTSTNMATTNPLVEATYFIQPNYNFGPHLYAENSYDMPDRQGSLSITQQRELMDQLETAGLSGIDSYLNLTPQYYANSTAG
jgi:hypothetical protein